MRKDKERDCGCNYPIYPNYGMQNMMPGVPSMPNIGSNIMPNSIQGFPMNMYSSPNYMQGNISSNSMEQQISALSNQISSLERRINNLENLVGNNKYNTSNYQML